jgi:hypothetical protein
MELTLVEVETQSTEEYFLQVEEAETNLEHLVLVLAVIQTFLLIIFLLLVDHQEVLVTQAVEALLMPLLLMVITLVVEAEEVM